MRRWFEGLSDTLRTLTDAVGGAAPAPLVRLQRELEAAYDSRPATIAAARQWLDRIDASVAEVAAQVAGIPGPDSASAPAPASEATFWADALVRQCRIMQDELAFLAPWSALPRRAERSRRPPGHPRDSDVARACGARSGIAAGHRARGGARTRRPPTAHGSMRWAESPPKRAIAPPSGWRRSSAWCSNAMNWPAWSTTFSTTGRVTCWPSGTTSASAGGIRVITICSLRKRGSPVSWRLHRDSCRRRTGSRSGACSRPRGGNRYSCPGAVRCSST